MIAFKLIIFFLDLCKKLANYNELPDDLFSLFLIDCAFGLKTDMDFLRLDEIPNGKLRQGIEKRILKHYKFYMRKMGGLNNIMEHSSHLIPSDSMAWSNESIDNAKFDSPSPSPSPANFQIDETIESEEIILENKLVASEDVISASQCPTLSYKSNICSSSPCDFVKAKFMETILDSQNIEISPTPSQCKTPYNSMSPWSRSPCEEYFSDIPDSQPIEDIESKIPKKRKIKSKQCYSDLSCNKENIPPYNEIINSGQSKENSKPLQDLVSIYGKHFLESIENAPIAKRTRSKGSNLAAKKLNF